MYTLEEKMSLVTWYLQGHSSRRVSEMFAGLFPNRPIPSKNFVLRLINLFKNTGCLNDSHKKRNKRPSVFLEENDVLVCAAVENDPSVSLRGLEENLGLNREGCRKVLKKEGYKSYKVRNVQMLHQGDDEKRMGFCEIWNERINHNPRAHYHVLFTDECTVNLSGTFNSQNVRVWAKTNPRLFNEAHHQIRQKVNVWAGILGSRVIGPFFIEGNVNGQSYLQFLQNTVLPTIQQLNLPYDVTFMHDGHPAHGEHNVTAFLNDTFREQWIGQRGPCRWPPRSPDLNPMDFFFWGYLKNEIFNLNKPQSIEELRRRIVEVANTITPQMLRNVLKNFYERLAFCSAAAGLQFEHLI